MRRLQIVQGMLSHGKSRVSYIAKNHEYPKENDERKSVTNIVYHCL